ncbi:MAG: hypothetical protein JO103_01410 [Candidatus Eremiobacteraeota bacterium]|nr:hypothetical protein [Candidatus Eremiobacteraeota bacterium]MBV9409403.1 hypothetical protein [Candidatus Eremiobacteraeota bacterium]
MQPMPGMTTAPTPKMTMAPAPHAMRYNANGVLSMYGMTKSGMRMDMSALDPGTMPSTTDVGTPMTREGSGTSWMPDADTLYARMDACGDDMEMTHGALWGRFVHTATPRGADALVAPGWFMVMRSHPTSPGAQLGVRMMFTPDPFSVGGQGYPLLFQTGEQWRDQPLHDFQHPHDLIAELSLTYSGQLGKAHSAFLYVGYPGEPALGPPAYMHRPIAYDLAAAPVGHHWEDATHITFGVVTAGVASTKFKLEASAFTGREPNEARYNFDPVHLDSHSARLSWNPNAFVAAQVSYGYVTSPEAAAPAIDVRRTTASVMYTRPLGFDASWTHTVVFGRNDDTAGECANALLYETEYRRGADAVFARAERVNKSGSDLVLPPLLVHGLYDVGAYTIGVVHDLPHRPGRTVAGIGADLTVNTKPASLDRVYGAGAPVSFEVFYRIRSAPLVGQDTTH